MNTFQVNDIACGRVATTIRNGLSALDPAAKVSIEVNARRVDVESGDVTSAQLQGAIDQAGYTPAPPGKGGSGCGCG